MATLISFRSAGLALASVTALLVPLSAATAQGRDDSFPSRPIRMILPYVAGGSLTVVGRHIANKLSENTGQSVIVDNRGGASGKIGAEAAAKANPDGYTLLLGESGSMAINVWLMDRTGSHPLKDFVAVAQVVTLENVLVAHPSAGVKNLRELVAKANTSPIVYGSSGAGTVGHLAMEVLRMALNIKATHVPYKGGSQAIADLMGGQIPMLALTVPTAAPHVLSGRLYGIAALGASRTAILPDVPTVAEQGYAPIAITHWYGFFAPAGTPKTIVTRLNAEIRKAVAAPEVTKGLVAAGSDIAVTSPEEFAKTVGEDVERWRKIVQAAGLQPN